MDKGSATSVLRKLATGLAGLTVDSRLTQHGRPVLATAPEQCFLPNAAGDVMRVACLIADELAYPVLRAQLETLELQCERFSTDHSLVRGLSQSGYDAALIELSWNQPLEERVLSWLQCRTNKQVPIVLQTQGSNAQLAARALAAGVDDVVVRGVAAVEIAARLLAAVRRRRSSSERVLRVSGFELDHRVGCVIDQGVPVMLKPREFALAWLMFSNAGQCISRRTISVALWGLDTDISGHTIEQHAHRLRKLLRLGVSRGVTLRASYGVGYRLQVH
jgi:DNA-binding response OmpR family regulator